MYIIQHYFRYMLSTQFQATDARKAFPCLDEPQLRAEFQISIDIRDTMNVMCNTEELDRDAPV